MKKRRINHRFNRHHNHPQRSDRTNKKSSLLKKFGFWFMIYFISILILFSLFENTQLYKAKIGYYIFSGLILILISRVVYSSVYKKKFELNGLTFWGLIYIVSFGLVNTILMKLPQIQINPSYDKYIFLFIFSIVFTLIIIFLRRMKLGNLKRGGKTPKFLRAPSQIFTGIALIVLGILTFRFSYTIFITWFGWTEGLGWSWLLGVGLIIGGFLTLIAWWRNNVSMFTTKHNIKLHK